MKDKKPKDKERWFFKIFKLLELEKQLLTENKFSWCSYYCFFYILCMYRKYHGNYYKCWY